jgi:hypothetical protein
MLGGIPAFAVFTIADLIRGRHDASYWREIPVNTVAFATLTTLAFARHLPRGVRGAGLSLSLAAVAISDQAAAGAGGLAPALLTANSALLACWHPAGDALGAAINTLTILGPACFAHPSRSRAGTATTASDTLLRWGATLLCGLIVSRATYALRDHAQASLASAEPS